MGFNVTTFVFETVNFLVLVWLLQRLVYRPLRSSIDERRARLERERQESIERLEAAERLETEHQRQTQELAEIRARALREAAEQAGVERARLLERAREDAAGERARVQRLLASERESAVAWVREMAVRHSTAIAGRFLLDLAPDLLDRLLRDQLAAEIDRRAEELGTLGRATGNGSPPEVELSFARMPAGEELGPLRDALGRALGRTPKLTVREDDALGAGLVLRFRGRVLDASIVGQLDAFRDRVRELIPPESELV